MFPAKTFWTAMGEGTRFTIGRYEPGFFAK